MPPEDHSACEGNLLSTMRVWMLGQDEDGKVAVHAVQEVVGQQYAGKYISLLEILFFKVIAYIFIS